MTKNKFVIIEGLDKTGKSTLCDILSNDFNFNVVHFKAPDTSIPIDKSIQNIASLMNKSLHSNVCFDRSYYGDIIFSRVYNRATYYDETILDNHFVPLERSLQDKGVQVIKILMHDDDIDAHWKRLQLFQEPLTYDQFLLARKLYDRLVEKYNFMVYTYLDIPKIVVQHIYN